MRIERFFGKNYHYIWSDGWCLDKNRAWLLAGAMDILFCLNMETKETTLVDAPPSDRVCDFRQHPRVIKIDNVVICLPDFSNDIWFYHLDSSLWNRIIVDTQQKVRTACYDAWFSEGKLYVVSRGLKQIVEINMQGEYIEHYHELPISMDNKLKQSVLIDTCIYSVTSYPVNIYKFNCSDKSVSVYEFIEIEDEVNTLLFDGNRFWMSGKCKKIYIWDVDTENIMVLNLIPDFVGIWNFSGKYDELFTCDIDRFETPMFINSIMLGNYIWFIPFQTNDILYVNKETLEIEKFVIKEEEENEEEVKQQLLQHKYLLEYIRDDRYIGLFSLKNKWVFEIDSYNFKYNIMDYRLDKKTIFKINRYILSDLIDNRCMDFEEEWGDLPIYLDLIDDYNKVIKSKKKYIGKYVYSFLKR